MQLRRLSQHLLAQPKGVQEHLERVSAALALEGTEPVQGALADMFVELNPGHADAKARALQACKERLSPRIQLEFEGLLAEGTLPRVNALATRWSLLSIPTADIPARARRCSLDDSRKLAQQGADAFRQQDAEGQLVFLDHCSICHDKMAFMLARREVLKLVERLPPLWSSVGNRLETL